MDFKSVTIKGFFGQHKISYTIPPYQRAYSWEEDQLKTFLEDLKEHKNSGIGNSYCYGNVLLETITKDRKWEIIDGQQRITTISIFIRSLINVLGERLERGESLIDSAGDTIDLCYEEEVFLKDHGVVKLQPTQGDMACFETVIVDNHTEFLCQTPSQHRILFAKTYFTRELRALPTDRLINIYEILNNSTINKIELTGKKESALMFELQNNRGKDLTNLEKLKSFLMYQLYVYSEPEETEANITKLSNYFNPIYTLVNQMSITLDEDEDDVVSTKVTEDNILLYHSYAYSKKHFSYRNLNDIFDEFKAVPPESKVDWISDYACKLYNSFSFIQRVIGSSDKNLLRLKKMNMPFFVYPFLIRCSQNKENLPKLFALMEVLGFRYKLVSSRADIRGKLTELIKDFDGDVELLAAKMANKMEAEYYWGDKKVVDVLNGNMYKNTMINYFLWEYEQFLQSKGYTIGDLSLEKESIEHIAPQTEPDNRENAGYPIEEDGLYSQEFRDAYVNKLGNLMLISQSHNSSIGNVAFAEKLASYNKNPLLNQQAEIKSFVKDEEHPLWDAEAIDKRHKKMLEFALRRWAYIPTEK